MPSRFNPIGQNTPLEQALSVINGNFAELDNENVNKIFKDGQGNDVIIGRLPDDTYGMLIYRQNIPNVLLTGTTGIKVAQSGVDVTTATDDQLVMSSDFNLPKIVQTGSVTVTLPALPTAWTSYTATATHDLGFTPAFLSYCQIDPGLGGELVQTPDVGVDALGNLAYNLRVNVDSTNITFRVQCNGAAAYNNTNWAFKYYLLRETAQ